MRRLSLVPALLLAMISSAGCYHVIVDTGMQPSDQTISKPWAPSFIDGLVPPSVVETASKCPNGVAKVSSQLSFLNLVVGVVTFGIFTPMQIDVTCSTGSKAGNDNAQMLRANGQPGKVLAQAAALARDSGHPVYVSF